jgi:hypothetical protein
MSVLQASPAQFVGWYCQASIEFGAREQVH